MSRRDITISRPAILTHTSLFHQARVGELLDGGWKSALVRSRENPTYPYARAILLDSNAALYRLTFSGNGRASDMSEYYTWL